MLFNEGSTWMKKDGLSDVTMGAYDGAEVCELVGTFLLDKISEKYDKSNIGLKRNDELSVFKNKFYIVAEYNLKIVNYLDMTLNLNDG